jgi:hypothetical protein
MKENISIRKNVYSIKNYTNVINTEFSELTTSNSDQEPSIDEFFDMYNELYFTIPLEGDLSHTAIVRKSNQLLNFEDPRDSQIIELQNTIQDLEQRLLEADNEVPDFTVKEHPLFPNGSLVAKSNMEGSWPHVYYMDQGFARGVQFTGNGELYSSFRKLLGYTDGYGDNPIPRFSNSIIAGIPKGPDLTEYNMNEKWPGPSATLQELEQLRIDLDPEDAQLNISLYNGDYNAYKTAIESDYQDKSNLLNSLQEKENEIRQQITQITGG